MAILALGPGDYFTGFPSFTQNPQRPLKSEFGRLAQQQGWMKYTSRYSIELEACLHAQFSFHVVSLLEAHTTSGLSEMERLHKLQAACTALKLPLEGLNTINKCKQALKTRVHVNMWDLIDSRRVGTDVKLFKTPTALAAYTLKTRKFFPLYIAKGNEISKSLLRPIR